MARIQQELCQDTQLQGESKKPLLCFCSMTFLIVVI